MIHLLLLLIPLFWLLGGQFGSAWRKYGILAVALILSVWKVAHGAIWWHYLPVLPFCAALFLGYGEKSWFMKVLMYEEAVRIAESLVLAIPLVGVALLTQAPWWAILAQVITLVGAFQIRGGGIHFDKIDKDLLWVDVSRGIGLMIAVGVVL